MAQLVSRDLTLAERRDAVTYRVDDVIEFHSRVRQFRPGSRFAVAEVGSSFVTVRDGDGARSVIPLFLADHFDVYKRAELDLSVGDRVRITKNGKAKNGRRLDNGTIRAVVGLSRSTIELEGGVKINAGFGHLAHGYVVTSHASQGKTVDRVLIAQSSESFRASNREQFYVSASRARYSATVYTDDKVRLRRAIERSDPRFTATELLGGNQPPVRLWRDWLTRRLRWLRQRLNDAADFDPHVRPRGILAGSPR